MDKKAVFTHFSNILDNMIDESLFFDTFFQRPSALDYDIKGSVDDLAVPENISIKFGVSRGCIIDKEYDYVIKFDIETDDEDGGSLCEREVKYYHTAQKVDLAKYLAEAEYIGTYTKCITFYDIDKIDRYLNWYYYDKKEFDEDFMKNEESFGPLNYINISIPLYAYKKASTYNYVMLGNFEHEKYKNMADKFYSPLKREVQQIAIDFVYHYGMKEYARLSEFLVENRINDIHRGNIGSINGDLILIDYAGFHDCCCSEDTESWEKGNSETDD